MIPDGPLVLMSRQFLFVADVKKIEVIYVEYNSPYSWSS